MRIVIAGGTGLIGRRLVRRLLALRHDITVLSRSDADAELFPQQVNRVSWSGRETGPWATSISQADAVVNLAGASLGGGRWTKHRKSAILDSRLRGTRLLVDAMRSARSHPSVFVSASAVGFYGDVPDGDVDESRGAGTGFLADVCRQWEEEALKAAGNGLRVVTPRTGLVLDPAGGGLQRLVLPFRWFVGGPLGSGRQWMSWIHADDEIEALIHLLTNQEMHGPVNLTAPYPVRMEEFSKVLGRVLRRPSWAPVPSFALRLLLGEMSEIVLTGQRVVPKRLLENGFRFRYERLEEALRDLLTEQ